MPPVPNLPPMPGATAPALGAPFAPNPFAVANNLPMTSGAPGSIASAPNYPPAAGTAPVRPPIIQPMPTAQAYAPPTPTPQGYAPPTPTPQAYTPQYAPPTQAYSPQPPQQGYAPQTYSPQPPAQGYAQPPQGYAQAYTPPPGSAPYPGARQSYGVPNQYGGAGGAYAPVVPPVAAAQPAAAAAARRSSEVPADAFIASIKDSRKYTVAEINRIIGQKLTGVKEKLIRDRVFKNAEWARALLYDMVRNGQITSEPTDPTIQGWLDDVRSGRWVPQAQPAVQPVGNAGIHVAGVQQPVMMSSPVNVPAQYPPQYPQQGGVPRELSLFPPQQTQLLGSQDVINTVSTLLSNFVNPRDGTAELSRVDPVMKIIQALNELDIEGLRAANAMITKYRDDLKANAPAQPPVAEAPQTPVAPQTQAPQTPVAPPAQAPPARTTPPVVQAPYVPQYAPQVQAQPYAPQPFNPYTAPQPQVPQAQPTNPQAYNHGQAPYNPYAPQAQPQYATPAYPPAANAPFPGAYPVLPVTSSIVAKPLDGIIPGGGVEDDDKSNTEGEASSAAGLGEVEEDDEESEPEDEHMPATDD